MAVRRCIGATARRARLVARHHLGRTAATVEEAVRAVIAVHSSDPVTPPLALRARVRGFAVGDLDRALHADRRLWRLHAMRRTLFVVHVEEAATVVAGASRDVAAAERRRLERWVDAALPGEDAGTWLRAVEAQTLSALDDGRPRSTAELTGLVEALALRLEVGSGRWATSVPLSSRLLSVLALEARVVRAEAAGSWISSQYRWADRTTWFGDAVRDADLRQDPGTARARLAEAYLRTHGPATRTDLRWWTGWGARAADTALQATGAVEVDLDGPEGGWLLPDDAEGPPDDDGAPEAASSVCLLPSLDPTVMGWKERDWYLGPHAERLFDSNGNAGPTIWVEGRVAGGWAVGGAGEVRTRLLEDVGSTHAEAVAREAGALTEWLDGVRPTPRFRTPLERELSA